MKFWGCKPRYNQMKMKYNNVIQLFLAVSLSLLVFSACKKDDGSNTDSETKTYIYNLDVTDEGYTYQSGDTIAAMLPGNRLSILRLGLTSGQQFSGKATTVSQNSNYAFVFPSKLVYFSLADTIKIPVNTSLQNGLQSGLQQFRLGYSKLDTVANYQAKAHVTLQNQLATATFHFTSQGQPLTKITRLEISSVSGKFFGTQEYNVRKKAWETSDQNNLIINNSSGIDGAVVLNLIPTNKAQLCFNIETQSGIRYTGRCETPMEIKADQKYEIYCDCQSFDRKAHVGDYFYADGTYSSEYDYSKILAGIVFALTDSENGDINPSLKESNHGRVVSTTNVSSDLLRWTASSTYLYDIPSVDNFAGVLDTDTLNYLPKLDGSTLSLDQYGNIEQWPTKGSLGSFNGFEYTAVCDSSVYKHEAAYLCHNLSRAGFSNKRWYLPATGELALLYQLYAKGIICAATKQGFTDFDEKAYWSACEYNGTKAWAVNFITGMVFCNYKMSKYQVRPCLHF